jgi:hypothetical protein
MELKEVTISYRAGVKANLGNYESADISEGRTETWVFNSDDSPEAVQQFVEKRRQFIKEEVDTYLEGGYGELKGHNNDE